MKRLSWSVDDLPLRCSTIEARLLWDVVRQIAWSRLGELEAEGLVERCGTAEDGSIVWRKIKKPGGG